MEEFGPVQILVVGYENGKFTGETLDVLKQLRDQDVIRLVDLLFVTKDNDGNVTAVEHSDLTGEESMEMGAIAGALVGFGAEGDEGIEAGAEAGALAGAAAAEDGMFSEDTVWYIADAIPEGASAAIALIEHRWAIPFRDSILRAGGVLLADAWVHPQDLIAAGMAAAADSGD
jgi:uncharacterized membrane protein